MSTGSIRMSRMGQGVKGSWKSALKLETQLGGESRHGEEERTWSSRKLNLREERWQPERRHWTDVMDQSEDLGKEQTWT